MSFAEEKALDALLFESKGEELLDIKCFRGDRVSSADEYKAAIHSGIMQHKLQPKIASDQAPQLSVEPRDMAEFVRDLPTSA